MATVTRTTTWSDNQVLTASALNGEFNNLLNALALTNSDISGSAAIAYSKLNLSGSIVNADISSLAAIVESKITFSGTGHGHTGGTDGKQITEGSLNLSDNTTADVSTLKHGFVPKLVNDATKFLNGVGAWAAATFTGGSVTTAITMSSGTQKGRLGDVTSGETGPNFICRSNSASNKFVAVQINYPIPFASAPTITITNDTVYAPGSNVNRASGATPTNAHIQDANGVYVGFVRYYLDNTNFTANGAHLVAFNWSATV